MTPAALRFIKVEGLGNDFLLVDARATDLESLATALQPAASVLCDRRRGVGADGLLLVGAGIGANTDATMLVINADGSRPQMCGNGLRCVALWLARNGCSSTVIVDTDAGVRRCIVSEGADDSAEVDVDMGPATHDTAVTPDQAGGRAFARVSMGNPHAVAFVGPSEDPEQLARRLGPGLERDAAFPEGTNVELAQFDGDRITLWVWERGCGITAACGTGACATVAAAVAQGRVAAGTEVEVVLPGGSLSIIVPAEPDGGVRMRGPARLVFSGRWPA